jgi:transposase
MLKPDHFVFVDINLASCKSLLVRRVICGVGAPLLFLPSPQPDPNPIKRVFAKFKKSG